MTLVQFLVFVLAAWRLSSLILREKGPWDMFVHLRTILGSTELGAGVLSCLWCLSVWVGLLLAPLALWQYGWLILMPLSLSAGAIWLDGVIRRD